MHQKKLYEVIHVDTSRLLVCLDLIRFTQQIYSNVVHPRAGIMARHIAAGAIQ